MALSLLPRDHEMAMGVSKAAQACTSCKKQKRRCDKVLPACGLCARMGRPCDYTDFIAAPTAEDFASLTMKLAELEGRLNKDSSSASPASAAAGKANSRGPLWLGAFSRFPSVVFLDIDAFKWAGLGIPKPPLDIPMEVLEILSDGEGVQDAASKYFSTIHVWFPIISKKRMNLGIPLWDGGPDLAMLFLAMKLVTSPPLDGVAPADSLLYTASKRFAALLESSGAISMLYLQSLVLIALYEYGHGIYPSAWMTVGACVRYTEILGLPSYNESCLVLGQCTTWTESEERRRVWWAVFILDRVISLGSKKMCACEEPLDTYILPVDDIGWDEGDMTRCLQRPILTDISEPQSPFARLAQACLLISRALRHCREAKRGTLKKSGGSDVREATALTESLSQLCHILDDELAAKSSNPTSSGAETATGFLPSSPDPPPSSALFFSLLAPRCLALSAVVMILDIYSCPETQRDGPHGDYGEAGALSPERLVMQVQAIDGLREASEKIRGIGRSLAAACLSPSPSPSAGGAAGGEGASGLDRVSPLALDAVYCALATFHWLWKEGGDAATEAATQDVRACLSVVSTRWRLAAEYLVIEEHHDVTNMMALRAGQ
ncbi:Regulator of drug sensitivity 1 [Pleurostoma richardsiae]|uniref:Regulator of drug sensitivity 1 n=1 Tax=Pleurostoma richardsiae TaxID=41990 RepID=A0AA38RLM4_9PEZI|nr:Regulator of drug sensitivity 1 [Pleurostoma richardsiae]